MKAIPFLVAAMLAIATGTAIVILAQENSVMEQTSSGTIQLPFEGDFPSLTGATTWLNSEPLTPASLHGKVVLVDFWTYTCINWLRTLPYVRAWAEKYKAQGLVVIGAHTPEFSFEHNLDNVRAEAKAMHVDYPIAVDSDYGVWNAFDNQYWPALYIIDAQGHIRHHQFGEGGYEESERVIQQLLVEAGRTGVSQQLADVKPAGAELGADWSNVRSPESYLGYDRTENFVSPGGAAPGERRVYAVPAQLFLNDWALSGDWTFENELVRVNQANGRLVYHFHARDVNLIMGPAAAGTSVRFRVLIDGQMPGAAHGVDIDAQGNGMVADQRMYQLIRQPQPIVDRQFEIEFLDAGAEAFDFTFG